MSTSLQMDTLTNSDLILIKVFSNEHCHSVINIAKNVFTENLFLPGKEFIFLMTNS